MTGPLDVRHIDLAAGPADTAPTGRAAFTVYWWRDLPLGYQLSSADELPQSAATLRTLTAQFAAEQRVGRDPALHAPMLAGSEGYPRPALTLAEALQTEGFTAWLDAVAQPSALPADHLTLIVCTRDRGAQLTRCLQALLSQRSPAGELIVVDNSADGNAAEFCAGVPQARYVHEPRPGLSHARNAGIAAATRDIVAFTDDDVTPHPGWTAEIVRAFAESPAEAVTGLVLPLSLETPAQRAFQIMMGGFGDRFQPVRFNAHFFNETLAVGAHVWRIGAGANMAFRRSVFARVGLFDARLGAGASGCSEDSELWYRILATGGECFYDPRAVVFHEHRTDWPGLERQIRAYMRGHVSALVAQADMFGHHGNIRRIFLQLPRYFVSTLLWTVLDQTPERRKILRQEVAGWASGLLYLFRPGWRYEGPVAPRAAGVEA